MNISAYLREIVTVLAQEFGFRSYRDAERLEKAADRTTGVRSILLHFAIRDQFTSKSWWVLDLSLWIV